MYNYIEYVKNGGKRRQKLKNVSERLYEKFQNARKNLLPVHDIDLKRWALEIAKEENLNSNQFKASDSWIAIFKRKHRISARKITKFMTKSCFID